MKDVALLLGRLALLAIFAASALNKVTTFDETRQSMETHGVPEPALALVGAIVFLVIGSLSLLVGFLTRMGCFLLVAFLIAATWYFEVPDVLEGEGPELKTAQIEVMKNLAILGGLLVLMGSGPGKFSLDARGSDDGGDA